MRGLHSFLLIVSAAALAHTSAATLSVYPGQFGGMMDTDNKMGMISTMKDM